MSAIANITAFDGAATPVSHTLVPVKVNVDEKGVFRALWRENNAALPIEASITYEQTLTRLKSGVVRVDSITQVPVMESVSGQNSAGYTAAPAVAFIDKYVTSGYQHRRSTPTSRRLARQLHVNVLGSVSTTVTPVQTGPAPEMFDLQVMPT